MTARAKILRYVLNVQVVARLHLKIFPSSAALLVEVKIVWTSPTGAWDDFSVRWVRVFDAIAVRVVEDAVATEIFRREALRTGLPIEVVA